VKDGLKLDNLRTDHVMIRSELKNLIGAKIVHFKCRVFGGKTAPSPTFRDFRVVRPVATVRFQVERKPEPTAEFGPVAKSRPLPDVTRPDVLHPNVFRPAVPLPDVPVGEASPADSGREQWANPHVLEKVCGVVRVEFFSFEYPLL
jgi:hypothetical protein